MIERAEGYLDRPVNSLSEILLSEQTLDSLLGHIGHLGVKALDGWNAAATSIVERDRVASFGVTDERIHAIDQRQYDRQAGPCVDALRTGKLHYFDGQEMDARWHEFAEAAADANVHSVLSFPLKIGESNLGAINFYSSRPGALKAGQKEEGWVFASQAAISLANLKEFHAARQQVSQLEEGLQTRTVIGQATGLLMAQDGLSSQEAFEKLVHVSQTSNIKLREIAGRYVEAWGQTEKGLIAARRYDGGDGSRRENAD